MLWKCVALTFLLQAISASAQTVSSDVESRTTVVVRSGVKIQEFPRPSTPHPKSATSTTTASKSERVDGWRQRSVWRSRRDSPSLRDAPDVRDDALPSFRSPQRPPTTRNRSKPASKLPAAASSQTAGGEALSGAAVLPGWEAIGAAEPSEASTEPLRARQTDVLEGREGSKEPAIFNPFANPAAQLGSQRGQTEAPSGEEAARDQGTRQSWRTAWRQNSVEALPAASDSMLPSESPLFRPMRSLTVDIAATGAAPEPVAARSHSASLAKESRLEGGMLFWEAPGTMHQPLYFEDVNLERAGHSWGVFQPAMSAVHFFGRIPALPYLAAAHPPRECVYTLGHYRPGSCSPQLCRTPRVKALAGAAQAGVITGLIFLVP